MKNTLETRLGVFFALALIVAFIVMEMVGSFDFMKPGRHVRARFASVLELNAGDPVKMGGYRVGRVVDIHPVEGQIEVVMKLEDFTHVKTDSQASIRFSGLLGQNYVALTIGSKAAQPVEDNFLFQSTEQPDLGAIMTKLDNVASGIENVTRKFSGDQIDNLLGPLTDVFKENKDRISEILENARKVTGEVAKGQGSVGKLIYEDTLHASALAAVTNFDATATQVRAALDDAKVLLADVREGQGTIGRLVQDPSLFRETTNAMTNLREILQKINQGQGTVGKVVNDETLYKNVRLSLQKLDKATESLEDQGPISVIGIAVGKLF